MPLPPGRKLGPYEIVAPIGAGGMGEVYSARDTRLGRSVAVKVLAAHLSHRLDVRSRFEVEARSIASLNHPGICALFDVGEEDGIAFMVMEHLEGETVAARLIKGPLPLTEALRFASDIAQALEQAHKRGIAHRDLKPANIMLTRTGPKLLDFGLARLREQVAVIGNDDPTLAMTREGVILGTPQYMAPEQVQGKATDGAADIFAFGSVLYEMLTARRAFQGANHSEIMAAILRCELPPALEAVPAALNRTLRICWAKDPDDRWQSAGDLRRELLWIAESPKAPLSSLPVRAGFMARREILAWGTAALAGTVAGAAIIHDRNIISPKSPGVRFGVAPPPGTQINFFQSMPAVSPDGKLIAFTAINNSTGRLSVWVRALNSLEMRELTDTDRAGSLFWSPDSRSLGFYADGKVKRVSLAGGSAQVICDSLFGLGGSWNQAGIILLSSGLQGAIHQVPASGGTSTPVTSPERDGHLGHGFPSWLPDGRHFLFTAISSQPERQGVYCGSLDSRQTNRLISGTTRARYLAPGYLLFSQDGAVMAQRFDFRGLKLDGDAFRVADGAWTMQKIAAFDVSESGVLAFAEAELLNSQLTWFDRSGKPVSTAGEPGAFIHMELSRDEHRVLLERKDGERGDLWILNLERNVPTRLTYGPGWAVGGIWSPDGTQALYSLFSDTSAGIYSRDAGGTGQERQLPNVGEIGIGGPSDWSRDGRYLVFGRSDPKSGESIWAMQMSPDLPEGERQPVLYLKDAFIRGQARLSPDGKRMAYVSTESQTPEIYVSPFPNATAKLRISTAGGTQPRWSADGRELFYLALDHTLMAVPVPGASGSQPGQPAALFQAHPAEYCQICRYDYAPSSDGRRFLVNTRVGTARPQGMQVIVGWQPPPV